MSSQRYARPMETYPVLSLGFDVLDLPLQLLPCTREVLARPDDLDGVLPLVLGRHDHVDVEVLLNLPDEGSLLPDYLAVEFMADLQLLSDWQEVL